MSVPAPVAGDAGVVASLARKLGDFAVEAGDTAARVELLTTGDWVGKAANAFADHVGRVPAELRKAGSSFEAAAVALGGFANTLADAQADASRAMRQWAEAQAETASWQRARAAGALVSDVDPGEEGRDAAARLYANTLDWLDSEASRVAKTQDGAASEAPHKPGFWSRAWHDVCSFSEGVWESTAGMVKFAWDISLTRMLVDPVGWMRDAYGLAEGIEYGITHPVAFAKAAVDWDTWLKDPARALGELLPNLVLTIATDGGGAAAEADEAEKGLSVVSEIKPLREIGEHADEIDDMSRGGVTSALRGNDGDEPIDILEGDGHIGGEPIPDPSLERTAPESAPGPDVIDSSRAGVLRIGDDEISKRVSARVPVSDQVYTVVIHGTSEGFDGTSLTDVISAVRPLHEGNPICLFSCFGANNGTAQALADALHVVVRAPTSEVGLLRHGPAIPALNGGRWITFVPGGR